MGDPTWISGGIRTGQKSLRGMRRSVRLKLCVLGRWVRISSFGSRGPDDRPGLRHLGYKLTGHYFRGKRATDLWMGRTRNEECHRSFGASRVDCDGSVASRWRKPHLEVSQLPCPRVRSRRSLGMALAAICISTRFLDDLQRTPGCATQAETVRAPWQLISARG